MFRAKYVIIDGSAIVFFEGINHSDMVGFNEKCESAGFVSFRHYLDEDDCDSVKAVCYGKSISLGIESRGDEDSEILTRQLCRS